MLLCYKYHQQPGLFIDESAYANEINSIICSWNSIQPYGIMFPSFFIVTAVEAWGKIKNQPLVLWQNLINMAILSFVSLLSILAPNYNI